MPDLLIGLFSVLIATNQPVVVSNLVPRAAGVSVSVPDKNDPVEKELSKLMAEDDAAEDEIDEWLKNARPAPGGDPDPAAAALQEKIKQRLEKVRRGYEDFLQRHPGNARGHIVFGSFLNDIEDEPGALAHWEKGRDLDPKNPAAWNNLANYYGHNGPTTNAFVCYQKAIELNPSEPTYYRNFATTVFLFRRDATNFFNIDEQQVFARSLQLYRKALELDPGNFLLATDLAQTYYGINLPGNIPPEARRAAQLKLWDEALVAWQAALKLTNDETARQGIHTHFARININAGRFDEARRHLNTITNASFTALKETLTRKLARAEDKSRDTNAPAIPPK